MDFFINEKSKDILVQCKEIMDSLPDFFNEHGLELFEKDILVDDILFAEENGKVLGFATLKRKFNETYDISWFAVREDYWSKGIGSQLIDNCASFLKLKGAKILSVKTLAETIDYEPYKRTRGFYEKNGFIPVDIIKDYPEWDEGNDCKIYVKVI